MLPCKPCCESENANPTTDTVHINLSNLSRVGVTAGTEEAFDQAHQFRLYLELEEAKKSISYRESRESEDYTEQLRTPKEATTQTEVAATSGQAEASANPKEVMTQTEVAVSNGHRVVVAAPREASTQTDVDVNDVEVEVVAASDEEDERQRLLMLLQNMAKQTQLGMVSNAHVTEAKHWQTLGRGQFASVSAVEIADSDQGLVAAKRFEFRPQSGKIPLEKLQAALREATAMLAVHDKPNVITLLGIVLPGKDFGFVDTAPPLQLLLPLSDRNLDQLLRDKASWEQTGVSGRRVLLADSARGLAVLHAACFAHLDVRSHNVLVDPHRDNSGWTARICDLGSARPAKPDEPRPLAEGISGWAAPELVRYSSYFETVGLPKEPLETDPRLADCFGFGVLIWDVVSGPSANNPLAGMSHSDYVQALDGGTRPTFPDGIAGSEKPLAITCWDSKPAKRPAMLQILTKLEAMLSEGDVDNGAAVAALEPGDATVEMGFDNPVMEQPSQTSVYNTPNCFCCRRRQ